MVAAAIESVSLNRRCNKHMINVGVTHMPGCRIFAYPKVVLVPADSRARIAAPAAMAVQVHFYDKAPQTNG